MIPVTLSIENKKVVIVGGGNIAKRKAKSYLENKAQVIIISPDIFKMLLWYIQLQIV